MGKLLLKGIRWQIDDDSNVKIYEDPWLSRPHTFKVISPRMLCANSTVNDLIVRAGVWIED